MKMSETRSPDKSSTKTKAQMSSHMPGAGKSAAREQLSARWEQHMSAAKSYWGKLSDDQLMMTKGDHQKLVDLIQEKYNITRDEADKQVNKFAEKILH
jgi:uncharacterized protein YjbJ (UPF0337 family)